IQTRFVVQPIPFDLHLKCHVVIITSSNGVFGYAVEHSRFPESDQRELPIADAHVIRVEISISNKLMYCRALSSSAVHRLTFDIVYSPTPMTSESGSPQ
ncbi:hypothetical protein PENTCL1PPCAC_8607, partial [Pristionchus entomophagus]